MAALTGSSTWTQGFRSVSIAFLKPGSAFCLAITPILCILYCTTIISGRQTAGCHVHVLRNSCCLQHFNLQLASHCLNGVRDIEYWLSLHTVCLATTTLLCLNLNSLQASTSGTQREHFKGSRTSFGLAAQEEPQEKVAGEQQSAEWNFRVMTYNILAEGLVSHSCALPATPLI